MTDIAVPLALAVLTLGGLIGVSELAERVPAIRRMSRNPLVFGLALGVFATSWTLFGSVGFAATQGWNFLAIYLGPTLACLAIPLIWLPLARVVRRHRLGSVADLLAFRFSSRLVGAYVTLFLALGLLPYVALQTRAIADGAAFLAGPSPPDWLGSAYAALIGLFALVLGARYVQPRRQQAGLLVTLAAEAVLKLVAMAVVGGVVVVQAFGGLGGLTTWLAEHPEEVARLQQPFEGPTFPALVVLAAASAFLLPRQFHVAFVERPDERSLRHATWTLPLYLLLLNLPVPILLWGGSLLVPGIEPDLHVLAAPSLGWVRLLAFAGALSASSGMILVCAIALSGMMVNHVVIPLRGPRDLSPGFVSGIRRVVIGGLVAAGFAAHLLIPRFGTLVDLALLSFAAVLQLAPAVILGLAWTRATRSGALVGLTLGIGALTVVTLWDAFLADPAADLRPIAVWSSLALNVVGLVVTSLFTTQRPGEAGAALACRLRPGSVRAGMARPVPTLRARLAVAIGEEAAAQEIADALRELRIEEGEDRPVALAQLAEHVERNLAALIGPLAARVALGQDALLPDEAVAALSAELKYREDRGLETIQPGDDGAVLEAVRRNLVRVVEELPVGVCAAGPTGVLTVWNTALEGITDIPAQRALAATVQAVPEPWGSWLQAAIEAEDLEREVHFSARGRQRVVRITRAPLGEGPEASVALVVEELTERRQLRREAEHQDRLASIGRLAAGIAHEIRNPLTGVLMVAHNLRREPEAEDAAERLDLIVSEGQRIDTIVGALLTYTRKGEGSEPHPVDVGPLVEQAATLIRLGGRARGRRILLELDPELIVVGQEGALTQVLVNLLANARDAVADGGTVTVRGVRDDGDVVLDVLDDGPGVPEDLADRVFEPFFTTKDPGEGTGLGLAIAHRVVGDHGGSLQYARIDGLTRFRVRLPVAG